MKNKLTALIMSTLIISNSCTTTLVSSKRQNVLDDVLTSGKSYIFYKTDGSKEKLKVASISDTEINGKNTLGKETIIDRTDISQVKKENTLGTVGILVGAVAVAVLLPAYMKNEPVGGR